MTVEGNFVRSSAMLRAAACCVLAAIVCAKASAAQPAASGAAGTRAGGAALLGPPAEGGPVVVHAAFQLQNINAIDEQTETFEFTGILTLTWLDRRQAFSPDDEQVQEKIYQGNYQFNELSPAWYPQVVLANESGLYESDAVLLRVKPDGTNTLVQTINAVARADFDLRRYPFDRQRLEAVFEILGFDTSEVIMQAAPESSSARYEGLRMPEWTIAGIDSSTGEISAPYAGRLGRAATFVLTIDARRQSLFLMRLVVAPLILIVMLSWSVFWMDRSSLGDRINVSFVGILTAVAYQIVVGDIMPKISYFTLMNGFLNFSFWVMCATVVINLVVGACDQRGNVARGDLIDRRCRYVFPLVYFSLLILAVVVAFLVL